MIDNETGYKGKSLFNEAQFQIMRLHNCYSECNIYQVKGDYYKWNWKLDVIAKELTADIKKKFKIPSELVADPAKRLEYPFFKTLNTFKVQINEALNVMDKAKLYNLLLLKEQYLRCVQDDVGKGAKYEEVEDDMDMIGEGFDG